MTMDLSEVIDWSDNEDASDLKEISSKICYIGQPVKITDDYGVLRIALCSHDLRKVVKDLQSNSSKTGSNKATSDDKIVIKKLSLIANHFDDIEQKLHLKEKSIQDSASFDENEKDEVQPNPYTAVLMKLATEKRGQNKNLNEGYEENLLSKSQDIDEKLKELETLKEQQMQSLKLQIEREDENISK